MTYKVCYWDSETREQKERDATPEEVAEIEALKTATPPIPVQVNKFQAKVALLNAGLLDQVEALMIAPETNPIAKLAWTEVSDFRRDSPILLAIASQLSLTDEQIDNLFVAASKITA